MKEPISKIDNNKLKISFKKEFYEAEAVFTTAQKFLNNCTVFIDSLDASTIDVIFENKNQLGLQDLKEIAQEFCNEMIEQQLRLFLEKKFGGLRDRIVKQAFSPISYLENSKNEK